MRDLLEELRACKSILKPGSADSDVNVVDPPYEVPYALMRRAIAEIERLRSVAGAVSDGESMAEFKKRASGVC